MMRLVSEVAGEMAGYKQSGPHGNHLEHERHTPALPNSQSLAALLGIGAFIF
jgi:hypothetical protein